MKIIIYYRKYIDEMEDDDVIHVSSVWTIKSLISKMTTHEDIEGFIAPDAVKNPEFIEILKAIYEHKVNLWFDLVGVDPPGKPHHLEFSNTILEKFKIDLTLP